MVLLHGWTATADINFYRCYGPLGDRLRVLAFDHRGHGDGIRTRRPFRLADCAADVVALADMLGVEGFIPVGYSLGGTIAQLLAKNHAARVRGVVLCSTAARFSGQPINRLSFAGLTGAAALARVTPAAARRRLVERWFTHSREGAWQAWAIEIALAHDWRMVLEAGAALGTFDSTSWLGTLPMPASVLLTERDEVVPVSRQRELALLLRDVEVFALDAGHEAAVGASDRFVPMLTRAIDSVIARSS